MGTFASNIITSFVTARIDESDRGVFEGLRRLLGFDVVCGTHSAG